MNDTYTHLILMPVGILFLYDSININPVANVLIQTLDYFLKAGSIFIKNK